MFVLGIWQLAATIIGVHKAHEVPMGRAVLTVLLPMIVLSAISFLMFFFVCGGLFAIAPVGPPRRPIRPRVQAIEPVRPRELTSADSGPYFARPTGHVAFRAMDNSRGRN
jgi:hypothetical protein